MTVQVGEQAPDFTLPSSSGSDVTLSGLRGKKVVLYTYPKDDTPGCTVEACGFRDGLGSIEAAGAVVLGMSADGMDSHHEFIGKYNLNFELLSDEDSSVIKTYGAWGEKEVRGQRMIGILRMTFLIDEEGRVQKVWPQVTPDDHADEVLEAIRAG